MKQIKSKKRVKGFGEVYTQEREVKAMLDLVKEESYQIDSLFLEPACGNGNFLVEILKRKLSVCQSKEEVITSLSSIYAIDILEDNVVESKKRLYGLVQDNLTQKEAFFIMDQNIVCGDSLELLDKPFYRNVKFDVIIGNPPYQLNVGNTSGNSSKARAIYHKFIERAKELNPKYITMIVPSRWMTKSSDGIPDKWVDDMLNENKIKVLHDFLSSEECFPNVAIEGGVCYFLWDRSYEGTCSYHLHNKNNPETESVVKTFLNSKKLGVVIRDISAISILDKIQKLEGDYALDMSKNFSSLVSPKDFFTNKTMLTSSWEGYSTIKDSEYSIVYYLNKNIHKVEKGYIKLNDIPKNKKTVKFHKVYIPAANGSDKTILGKPFYGEPNSACSQTYLVIGYNHDLTKEQCQNIITYIQTKFFRYLVSIKKKTQNGARKVYQFVPMQDFSKPWTDAELYEKYDLTQEEIDYIEATIRPMK